MVFADSNSLNKGFYNELLYIMGLIEKKKNGNKNKIISRLPENKRQYASLVENVIEQLNINDVKADKQFDIAVQLVVVWINRILFLKLLESSLVSFNQSEEYKFLGLNRIRTFADLNDLFFAVMAKKEDERSPRIRKEYPKVPYMNSSLFEKTILEQSKNGISINELRGGNIEIYSKTVLKDKNNKRLTGKIEILEYLFRFLDAYDFSSTISAKNKKQQAQLINASVLGLILEKINGYKDGSFFTPGKITMYMAKKTMRRAITTKINKIMNWNVSNIEQIASRTRDFDFPMESRKKISTAIDNLKVLDPAVGSGHFLVSVLNEIISIKAALRVLFDANGQIMNDVNCTVANDELIIHDIKGDNYIYNANDPNSLRIQRALFEQKKIIIENCLYGVDLNPNSVNICRLRLWIELLKSAYYSTDDKGKRYLTTLPNIDINIKVGDSLIHRLNLEDKFDLRISDFKEYVKLVGKYKNTSDKTLKSQINKQIQHIKQNLFNSFETPEGQKFRKSLTDLTRAGQEDLFKNIDEKELARLKIKANEAKRVFEQRKDDPMYNNGLEWRMEFPEVLDKSGSFIGFDVVIANPPYIFTRNKSFDNLIKKYYLTHYEVDEYQANTYTLFMELGYKLLKNNGTFAYIVPNNMLTIQSNQKIRNFLIRNSGSLVIINSLDKIFADASVDNCLVFLQKSKSNLVTVGELQKGDFQTIGTVDKEFFGNRNPVFSISMVKYKNAISAYWKIEKKSSIKDRGIGLSKSGIEAYEVGKGNPPITKAQKDARIYHSMKKKDDSYLPYLEGKDVKRYKLDWSREFIKYGPNLAAMRKPDIFEGERILVRQIPSKSTHSIEATLTHNLLINDRNSMIICKIKNINPLTLLGIINSKIMTLWFMIKFDKFQRRIFPQFKVNELSQFPVPDMDKLMQEKIANSVKILMKNIERGDNCSINDSKVDELVMEAFGLTEEEKKSVREFEI